VSTGPYGASPTNKPHAGRLRIILGRASCSSGRILDPVVVHHWIGPRRSAITYHPAPWYRPRRLIALTLTPPVSRRRRPARLAVGTVATPATWFHSGHVSNPKKCLDSKLENHVSQVGIAYGEEVDDRPGFFDL